MMTIAPLTERMAWQALKAHYPKAEPLQLRQLFADDPTRGKRLTTEAVGIYFDYSKHRITDETLTLLLQLAAESGLRSRIDAMFRGDKINVTEQPNFSVIDLQCWVQRITSKPPSLPL